MCTVSVVATPDRSLVRLLVNRDERRLRPMAQPLLLHRTVTGTALWPIDPVSGGSWIAANDAGLALALLNMNGRRPARGAPSRGAIVPRLAACRSLDEAVAHWRSFDTTGFVPFRLVVVERGAVAVFESGVPDPVCLPQARCHVFSSSSLGDDLVDGPRRALLEELLGHEPDAWVAQTRFHQHAWPDRRHLSVMMSRVDACTASITELVLSSEDCVMTYRPVVDGWPAGATTRRIPVATRHACAA
ncbi:MAG: NRDE family protein [Acidobacteriota bacterium]|nr:NRDE family protein [Acidobacteriota bacterium]